MVPEKLPSVHDFLKETSMHGLKFTVYRDSRCLERLFWLLAFVAGLSLSTYFITKTWFFWVDNPVVTTVENTNYPVNEVPFPAVTICPVQQILTKKVYELIDDPSFAQHNLQATDLKELTAYLRKSSEFDENDFKVNFSVQNEDFKFTTEEYQLAMQKVAPSCEDIIQVCYWQTDSTRCNLTQIITPLGYCCVFNSAIVSLQKKKSTKALITENEGVAFGFDLTLHSHLNDIQKCAPAPLQAGNISGLDCHFLNFGFDVIVHDSSELPTRSPTKRHVGSGQILETAVQAVIMESEDDIRNLNAKKRDCVYPDEFHMDLPLPYTYGNCLINCLASYERANCSCIENYIQSLYKSYRMCNGPELGCIRNVSHMVKANLVEKCRCKPSCNEISYFNEAYIRDVTRNDNVALLTEKMNAEEKQEALRNVTIVRVYFRSTRFTKYRRSNRYNWQDFASSVGGLMGLGFGFSVISAIEIFYFFCYKCFCPSKSNMPADPITEAVVMGKNTEAWAIISLPPRRRKQAVGENNPNHGYY